jgi:hypothetical protein
MKASSPRPAGRNKRVHPLLYVAGKHTWATATRKPICSALDAWVEDGTAPGI